MSLRCSCCLLSPCSCGENRYMEIPTMGEQIADLKQQLAAAQARIAELREALEQVGCLMLCGKKDQLPGRCDNAVKVVKKALTKPDDLSALEAVKARVKREALIEAAGVCLRFSSRGMSPAECAACITSMAGEVK